jgi:hypothetical protein
MIRPRSRAVARLACFSTSGLSQSNLYYREDVFSICRLKVLPSD